MDRKLVEICQTGIKFLESLPETKSKCLLENRRVFQKMLLDAMPTPNTSGKHRRKEDLLAFLSDEHKRYRAEILPLYPDDSDICNIIGDYEEYDDAKNEFLESLCDVIS